MRVLLLLVALAATVAFAEKEPKVVCYFSSWAVYRPGLGKFDVENIDPYLCTHGIFGFAGLSNYTWTVEVLDPWNENCPDDDPAGNYCAYDRFVALKDTNPALKTILAVGGWNEGSDDYSRMVADPFKRSTFIESCIELVRKEGFDGLDIDWEYPTQRGGRPEDKENFIIFLDELRIELNKYDLIMTAALASGKPTVDPAYDVAGLVRNIDVLSIMTYDYHGAWENFTHHNAPLCGHPDDYGNFTYFNVVFSINYWLDLGAPADKLVMGIPAYGRCFTLDNIDNHDIWDSAQNPGEPGPYTRLPGTLGWNEICDRLKDSDCHSVRDPVMYEPYMYCESDKLWCGYDDEESVAEKARFARRAGVAGIMVWTIDTDDFVPTCGDTKFGLINSMKDAYKEEPELDYDECSKKVVPTTPETTTTTTPTTTTTTPTTTTTTPTTTTTTPTTTTTTPTTTTPTTTTTTPTTTTTTTPTTTTTTPTTTTTTPTTTTTTPTTTTPTTTTPTTTTTTTTTTPTTTTTTPTTTTTTPTTTTTTTIPRTTTTTTTAKTTTQSTITTTWNPYTAPDCDANPGVDHYPHADCNKFWWCIDGEAVLWLCSPGTYYDPDKELCDFAENVDTSNCNEWICQADGGIYPGADCDEYYECEHGQPVQRCCAEGLYFNQASEQCDNPGDVDTNKCNIPTDECTVTEVLPLLRNIKRN